MYVSSVFLESEYLFFCWVFGFALCWCCDGKGLARGTRAAFGGDERRHGPDREEKQQAGRAVEELPGTKCDNTRVSIDFLA